MGAIRSLLLQSLIVSIAVTIGVAISGNVPNLEDWPGIYEHGEHLPYILVDKFIRLRYGDPWDGLAKFDVTQVNYKRRKIAIDHGQKIPTSLQGMYLKVSPGKPDFLGSMKKHRVVSYVHAVHLGENEIEYSQDAVHVPTQIYPVEQVLKDIAALRQISGLRGLVMLPWYLVKFLLGKHSDHYNAPNPVEEQNFNVIWEECSVLALSEGLLPFRFSLQREGNGSLSPKGFTDFGGKWQYPLSVHSRVSRSGELAMMGYNLFDRGDSARVGVSTASEVRMMKSIKLARPSMMHDWAVATDGSFAVIFDLPLHLSARDYLNRKQVPLVYVNFSPRYVVQGRLGVVSLSSDRKDIQWFDIETCYVFHTVGVWRNGDIMEVIALRYRNFSLNISSGSYPSAELYRWELDLFKGVVKREHVLYSSRDHHYDFPQLQYDGISQEKPKHVILNQYSRGAIPNGSSEMVKVDLDTGAVVSRMNITDGMLIGEMSFVYDDNRPITDGSPAGYLVGFLYRDSETYWAAYDAVSMSAEPVILVKVPDQPHPLYGWHGSWVAQTQLASCLQ